MPESLPPEEDLQKLERRVKSSEKHLADNGGKIAMDAGREKDE
jgi:hypothetical protein